MRPAYTRPSARLLRLGTMLYAPLDRRPPIVATPAADTRQLDLLDMKPVEDANATNQ